MCVASEDPEQCPVASEAALNHRLIVLYGARLINRPLPPASSVIRSNEQRDLAEGRPINQAAQNIQKFQ